MCHTVLIEVLRTRARGGQAGAKYVIECAKTLQASTREQIAGATVAKGGTQSADERAMAVVRNEMARLIADLETALATGDSLQERNIRDLILEFGRRDEFAAEVTGRLASAALRFNPDDSAQ